MLASSICDRPDVVDPVVHEKDLPVAVRISRRMALRISSASKRQMRVSIACRSRGGVVRLEISRMPSSDMCSVRGIGVAVIVSTSTVAPQPLEHLLVLDAEPLLLVDDRQAEVLEAHVLLHQPMRADDDVHLAFCHAGQGLLCCWAFVQAAEST